MSQTTLEKVFKLVDSEVDNLRKKAKEAPLQHEDLVRLETLVRVYSIATNAAPKGAGRPPKVRDLQASDAALLRYAKGE